MIHKLIKKLHYITVNNHDYDFYITLNLTRFLHTILNGGRCLLIHLLTTIHGKH